MARKASPPRTEPIVDIVYRLDGSSVGYQVTLTDAEYWGIGFLTVQWAFLEEIIHALTEQLARDANVSLPKDATNFSFARRLRALRTLADDVLGNPDQREFLSKQLSIVARLAGQRQRITHHLWEYNPASPETLWSKSLRDKNARMEPFKVRKLHKLGQQVGEVAYALTHPRNPRPTSRDIFIEAFEPDKEGKEVVLSGAQREEVAQSESVASTNAAETASRTKKIDQQAG